ncbi:MAG: hypothetical protein WAX80_02915 [Minisyncoccia bacterium]
MPVVTETKTNREVVLKRHPNASVQIDEGEHTTRIKDNGRVIGSGGNEESAWRSAADHIRLMTR